MAGLVTTDELPALRQARRIMSLLDARDFTAGRVKLVLNRLPKRLRMQITELESVMQHSIYATVPDEPRALAEAYAEPRLVSSDTEIGKCLQKLASRLAGLAAASDKPRKFFLFPQRS